MTENNSKIGGYIESEGIFSAEPAEKILNEALQNRSLYAAKLHTTITNLAESLKANEQAQRDFFNMLDHVRAYGLLEMVKSHAGKLQYHICEHAAEVAYDTATILKRMYERKFPAPDEALINDIIRQIAIAAAAWHDVIQSLNAPKNEIESAKAFTFHMRKSLHVFEKSHPDCKQAIDALLNCLDFIANELIVYDTWLVFGLNQQKELTAKTMRQHAYQAESHGLATRYDKNDILKRLLLAADAISISDTSRFALEHVIEQKHISNSVKSLPNDAQAILERFFDYAKLHDLKLQEEFLGLSGQDIRMFCELNSPDSAYITTEQYHFFCKRLHSMRLGETTLAHDELRKMLKLFMTTVIKKAHATNIDQEIHFANAIGSGLWRRHASDLSQLETFYHTLNDQQQADLAIALFTLATTYQTGLALLQQDATFKTILEHELHPGALSSILAAFKKNMKDKLLAYQKIIAK